MCKQGALNQPKVVNTLNQTGLQFSRTILSVAVTVHRDKKGFYYEKTVSRL